MATGFNEVIGSLLSVNLVKGATIEDHVDPVVKVAHRKGTISPASSQIPPLRHSTSSGGSFPDAP
jgi:hypothetical protein